MILTKVNTADEARQQAIDWQEWQATEDLSYSEVWFYQDYFEKLAHKFPELTEEFKENGIL